MTNSLVSRILLEQKAAVTVGTGFTECLWTDRSPYHVVEVINHKTVRVRAANVRVVSGYKYDGSAEYEITPGTSEESGECILTLRSNGKWARQGASSKHCHWAVGVADYHYDPHF